MQISSDIKAVMEKIYQAMSEGNVQTFDQFLSRESGTLVIGTDPREWWSGYEVINHFLGQQIVEMGGNIEIQDSYIEAFSEGTVGWVQDRAVLVLNDGTRLPFRSTTIFHQEGDGWKMVQRHTSVGQANEEALGRELTV